jgi:hypothetical protein
MFKAVCLDALLWRVQVDSPVDASIATWPAAAAVAAAAAAAVSGAVICTALEGPG